MIARTRRRTVTFGAPWGPSTVLLAPLLYSLAAPQAASAQTAAHPNATTSSLVGLAPPPAHADFAAGIVALHDFWYEEAEARFRAVQRTAPGFTLGYWGEAMSLHRNPFGHTEPPVDSMRAVLGRLATTSDERAARAGSDHERRYLEALEGLIADRDTPAERHPAYARAMGRLAADYPDDIEARAFHARAILLEAPSFSHSREVQARTAEAARRVLELDPDHHGGLHYFIHGMDAPDTGPEALPEADRYQRRARGASHAVHMPSHIYLQVGDWDEVVRGNRAALRTSEQWIHATGRTRADLDRHAVDFLVYGLLQQGREREARAVLERTRADRAEFDTGALRWYDALWSARYAMELGARSDVPLPRSGYSSVGEALGLGLHALATGDRAGAESMLGEMTAQVEADAGSAWRIASLELTAALDGTLDAVPMLREAIALQSELPRPNETPDLAKPPEELLGELLLQNGRATEAAEAFQAAHARWPARLATRLGLARAAAALGDTARARARYATALVQLRRADDGHPARAEASRFLDETGGVPAATALEALPGRAPGTLPEVERAGTGPVPMVIIPCMSCRGRAFDTFMERNRERYTMFAVTLPGFGGTPVPGLPMNGDQAVWYGNAVDAVSALIEREDLRDVVVAGHSYGAVVALGVVDSNPGRVRAFVNLDGNVMSDRSWFRDDPAERLERAEQIWESQMTQFGDAEAWRRFNGSSRDDAARRALYHGMFMATPREVLLQYWRENAIVDLNPMLARLSVPMLDLQTLPGGGTDPDSARTAYLAQLEHAGAPADVHTVFLSETSHYLMEQRPLLVDRMIADFLDGERPADFGPGAGGTEIAPEDLARRWMRLSRATLADGAGAAEIDALLALYAPDAVYEHPRVGARIEGRDRIREGMLRFAGATRSPSVDLQGLVVAGNDVVLTLAVRMEARGPGDAEGWTPISRRSVVVLRIENGRVVRVTDYW